MASRRSASVKTSSPGTPLSRLAALRRMPLGSPSGPLTTSPPGGLGVSRVMPLLLQRE